MITTSEIEYCSPYRIKSMQRLGIKTNGTVKSMERIIAKNGFGLPSAHTENFISTDKQGEKEIIQRLMYGFTLQHKLTWTRITLTYPDALAEEIILLKQLQLI